MSLPLENRNVFEAQSSLVRGHLSLPDAAPVNPLSHTNAGGGPELFDGRRLEFADEQWEIVEGDGLLIKVRRASDGQTTYLGRGLV